MWKRKTSLTLTFLIASILKSLADAAEIGYFWHVSDFHLDTNYSASSGVVGVNRDYFLGEYKYDICWGGQQQTGKFGDYDCDASLELVRSAMAFVKNYSASQVTDGAVNFIVWTGDDTSHAEDAYFDEETVLDVIETITAELNSTGLRVFPVLGNHDFHPKNQLPVDPAANIYAETAGMWRHWLPAEAAEEYLTHCGSYQIPPGADWPFRLVALNTNVFYKSNLESEDTEDPCGLLAWLDSTLTTAAEEGEQVVLFAHVPPGKFERFYQYYAEMEQHGFPWFRAEFNERFVALIVRHATVLGAQLFGHHHTDSFKLYRDEVSGRAVSFALLAPSVTPWRSTLAPETGANNPGLRLFKYDLVTGKILDYDQFWLNLTRSNLESSANWEKEYTFSTYFGGGAAPSAESLAAFLDTWDTDDGSAFKDYYRANTVMLEEATAENCDSNCRTYHFCAVSELDYGRFETCVTNAADAPAAPALLMSVATIYLVLR